VNWHKYNLGDLVENFSVKARDIEDGKSLEFLGVSNEDGITISKYAAIDKAEEYKIIEKGCFAYNPYRINVGSIGLMNDDIKGLISPAYTVFKTKPNSIIPELLLKFLKSAEGLRQIKSHARGTVRQALRFEDLCKIELSLPDYEEQQLLYEQLNIIQTDCNILNIESTNQLALIKKLRHKILQDTLHGRVIPQNSEDESVDKYILPTHEKNKIPEELPFEIPKNWEWYRLGEVVKMSRGRFSIRPRNDPRYFNGEYPFIQIGSLDEKGSIINTASQSLNDMGIKVSKSFPEGTIVIAIVGGTIGNLGVLGREMYFTDSMIGILPSNKHNQNFILNFLRYKQPEIKSEAYQMAGQPNIKIPTLYNLLIAIPPLSEQNRIVTKIERLMKLCDELEQSIQQNQKYTQELLQVALKEALEPNKN
jgi:type I restriction enzyme, S subunit